MNPQITNLIIMLGMMQVTKKIPFEDPTWLNGTRAMYILSNLIIISLYLFVGQSIKKKNDMTTLKYVEPAPSMSEQEPKLVTTTVAAYDQTQLKSAYKAVLMGVGMMAVMHLYFKYTNPLVIQSIIPLKSAFEAKIVQIHVFGKPASGDLKRPWKTGGGLMEQLQGVAGGEATSDKKAIEEAERSGRGGAKEE